MKTIPILLAISLVSISFALEDTQENRSIEAGRYLKANPPSERFAEMSVVIAKGIPEAARENFLALMPKNLDTKALTNSINEILINTFTANELKALADFYSIAEGKSAMKKIGGYAEAVRTPMDIALRDAMSKTYAQSKPVPIPAKPAQK